MGWGWIGARVGVRVRIGLWLGAQLLLRIACTSAWHYVLNLTRTLPLTRSRSLALALTRARSLALALARAPCAQFLLSIAFISAWHTYGYFVSSGDAPT